MPIFEALSNTANNITRAGEQLTAIREGDKDRAVEQNKLQLQARQVQMQEMQLGEQLRQAQEARSLKEGMGEASKGGIQGIVEYLNSQGYAEKAAELTRAYTDIKNVTAQTEKTMFETNSAIEDRAINNAFSTLVATPPEARQEIYSNIRNYLGEKYGLQLPEQLTPEVMMSMGNISAEKNKFYQTMMSNPDMMRTLGSGLMETFTAEGQEQVKGVTSSIIGSLNRDKQRAENIAETKMLMEAENQNRVTGLQERRLQFDQAKANIDIAQKERGLDIKEMKALNGEKGIGQQIVEGLSAVDSNKSIQAKSDKIAELQGNVRTLERIKGMYDPELLGAKAKAKSWLSTAKDFLGKASEDDKEFIRQVTRLEGEVGMFLSAYAKAISGSAVAEPEFQRLARQLLNDKMTPAQFETAMERLMGLMTDEIQVLSDQVASRQTPLNSTGRMEPRPNMLRSEQVERVKSLFERGMQ